MAPFVWGKDELSQKGRSTSVAVSAFLRFLVFVLPECRCEVCEANSISGAIREVWSILLALRSFS